MTVIAAKIVDGKIKVVADGSCINGNVKEGALEPKISKFGNIIVGLTGPAALSKLIRTWIGERGDRLLDEWNYAGVLKLVSELKKYLGDLGISEDKINSDILICSPLGILAVGSENIAIDFVQQDYYAIGTDGEFVDGLMAAGMTPIGALVYSVDVRKNIYCSRPFTKLEVNLESEDRKIARAEQEVCRILQTQPLDLLSDTAPAPAQGCFKDPCQVKELLDKQRVDNEHTVTAGPNPGEVLASVNPSSFQPAAKVFQNTVEAFAAPPEALQCSMTPKQADT